MPAASGRMALFIFPDGRTLEIHVPGAARVRGGPSAARMAGFILRRGREIVNIGPLVELLHELLWRAVPRRTTARRR